MTHGFKQRGLPWSDTGGAGMVVNPMYAGTRGISLVDERRGPLLFLTLLEPHAAWSETTCHSPACPIRYSRLMRDDFT